MRLWNFYFIAKLFLYFGQYIGFHVWENLAFAAFLLVPVRRPRWEVLRQAAAIPAGVALFYYDTWLPPFERLTSQMSQVLAFSPGYIVDLLGRFISWPVIAALAIGFLAYYLISRRRSLTGFVVAAMLTPLLPLQTLLPHSNDAHASLSAREALPPPSATELAASLDGFFRQEAARVVTYPAPAGSDTPFDIIFLHICSLSWDDLRFVNEAQNPFFKRFDVVFTQFNSGTAYSGPAMIRLHRGSCGQEKHSDMYNPDAPQCHTLNALQLVGFDTQLALNHDGTYGGFLEELRDIGQFAAEPFGLKGLAPKLYSFDDSPIYDDYAVLSAWWNQRLAQPSQRVALYYNTITLHDGARSAKNWKEESKVGYQPRLTKLLGDLDRFFAQVAASGRRAVVVFIPEHGANLRGDRMQIAGMREIPSPSISIVPVGIRLINAQRPTDAPPLVVSTPTSYLAVSGLLADFLKRDPFHSDAPDVASYTQHIPAMEFVAENGGEVMVVRYDQRYFLHSKENKWVQYEP